jgi:hypothetical protein
VDGTVRQFDVRMGCMYIDQLHAPVMAMALSHDGNCILASCLGARLRLIDKESGDLLAQYTGCLWASVSHLVHPSYLHDSARHCLALMSEHTSYVSS